MQVVKSDGSYEPYDEGKVKSGIFAAFKQIKQKYSEENARGLVSKLDIYEGISTKDIREQVEDLLMSDNKKAARAYIKHGEDLSFIKSRIKYMDEYINSSENAATLSASDPNANVTSKNVSNLDGEVYKPTNRISQRYRVTRELKKIFPEVAKQYEKDIKHHAIYVHDETSVTDKNYCEAITLYPLLLDGTKNMDGLNIEAPKNLNSFCGQLVNLVFLLASQCKGAVAVGELFNYLDYFIVKEFGENYIDMLDEYADSSFVRNRKTIREKIHQAYQNIVYSWNQPSGNRSAQSPFTNISYYDSNYWHSLFDHFYFPDGSQPSWERVSFLQKDFMKWFNKERSKTLLTFPVETMALLTDGKDVIDKEYKDFTAEMWAEGHSFFLYLSDSPDSIASCCRLRNSLNTNELKEFSFSTGLSGVMTGSCNVITLNLNRIVQDYFRSIGDNEKTPKKRKYQTPEFEKYFCDIVNRVIKYHIAYKNILYDIENKGMLSASSAGYIKMDKLFSTIGVNGFNESAEFVGLKCNYNENYKNFCQYITGLISREENKITDKKYKMNLEFVPAESLGGKNYQWDKEDDYWVPKNRVLYNSYFYLADDPKTTVLDKLRMHGRDFVKYLSGGVGCHINLDEHLSKEQYLKLMDFAIKEGTTYYTFNIRNCSCDKCNHIEKRHFSVCPICGSTDTTDWTRIIGYLRPVKNFENARKIEESTRVYSKDIN